MIRFSFVLFFIFLFSVSSRAQREQIWVFTENNGLNFNGGMPVTFISGFGGGGFAAASVCDLNGQLQFFSDGNKVWGANNMLMPNGSHIVTATPGNGVVTNALIVPMPDSTDKYYLFSLTVPYANPGGGLYYSVIDMSLNGGLGDVEPGRKGILIDSLLNPMMLTAQGEDCNVWLITIPQKEDTTDNVFRVREITVDGISSVPVVSATPGYASRLAYQCRPDMSPDYRKMAIPSNTAELYDFNPATGHISNPRQLDPSLSTYALCFSPDNSKLYSTAAVGIGGMGGARLDQYDMSSGSTAAIVASRVQVSAPFEPSDLKRGPDGKIYYFNERLGNTLGAIQFPNLAGIACVALNTILPLPPISQDSIEPYTRGDFPGRVSEARRKDTAFFIQDSLRCSNSSLLLAAPRSYTYSWDDGSTASTRLVTQAGTYWVFSKDRCHSRVDSFRVKDKEAPVADLGPDIVLCTGESYILRVTAPEGAAIQWSTGSTGAEILVQDSGRYWVSVKNVPCSNSDTIRIRTDAYCSCAPLLPNAFSPNGDGLNDVYGPVIRDGCPVKKYQLKIYNRWGQLVFNAMQPKDRWDGMIHGKPADAGTYTYQLHIESGSKAQHYDKRGDLTLLR